MAGQPSAAFQDEPRSYGVCSRPQNYNHRMPGADEGHLGVATSAVIFSEAARVTLLVSARRIYLAVRCDKSFEAIQVVV